MGRTPLSVAAAHGSRDIVRLLSAAAPSALLGVDKKGKAAIHKASANGHAKCIQELLCCETVKQLQLRTKTGATPLHEAALWGQVTAARQLLKAAAATTRHAMHTDSGGLSCAEGDREYGKTDRPTPAVLAAAADNGGQTPLHHAACKGQLAMVQALLVIEGIDIDSRNAYGASPLLVAAAAGHGLVIQLLLRTGARVDLVDHTGQNVLHHAVVAGGLGALGAVLDMLRGRGNADAPEMAMDSDKTVGALLLVGLLLQRDSGGYAPLHTACAHGRRRIVGALLAAGANPEDLTAGGATAADVAAGTGLSAITAALEEHGLADGAGSDSNGTRDQSHDKGPMDDTELLYAYYERHAPQMLGRLPRLLRTNRLPRERKRLFAKIEAKYGERIRGHHIAETEPK